MPRFSCPPSRWHGPTGGPPEWVAKRRFLFFRFGRFLAGAFLLFLLVIGGLAFLFTRLLGGDGQAAGLVWLVSCGLALSFPVLVGLFAFRYFASVANPLAQVMAAADAVADGDMSARVPETAPGEFGRLARSFNRMVSELQRSDQLRRNLTADVAHELRTPLHIIQGNLEGIQDGVYAATPEQIDLLLDETQQLTRLVDDLRTLSLAEAGQLPLEHEPVDLAELVQDVATSFSGPAEAAGVALEVEKPPAAAAAAVAESWTITGDAGRLEQVLGNLIANALRHTSPGGKITLRANQSAEDVTIQVADTGSGIPAEDQPFIFDRFWRGNGSRRSSSGLGLAIARQLVQSHGGTIAVESQENAGTTFTISLPRNP